MSSSPLNSRPKTPMDPVMVVGWAQISRAGAAM
jgi:hypothetical protein